jgi:spermidine/putrescine transport system ATP-binding protein
VEQVDEPSKLYGQPQNRFVADFIGHINQLVARVLQAEHGQHVRLEIAGLGEVLAPPHTGIAAGTKGVFAIRPEQVRIGTHEEVSELKNHFRGEVLHFLYRGDVTLYTVRLGNGTVIGALLPNAAPGRAKLFEVGDQVMVGWRRDAGMFLHE